MLDCSMILLHHSSAMLIRAYASISYKPLLELLCSISLRRAGMLLWRSLFELRVWRMELREATEDLAYFRHIRCHNYDFGFRCSLLASTCQYTRRFMPIRFLHLPLLLSTALIDELTISTMKPIIRRYIRLLFIAIDRRSQQIEAIFAHIAASISF